MGYRSKILRIPDEDYPGSYRYMVRVEERVSIPWTPFYIRTWYESGEDYDNRTGAKAEHESIFRDDETTQRLMDLERSEDQPLVRVGLRIPLKRTLRRLVFGNSTWWLFLSCIGKS